MLVKIISDVFIDGELKTINDVVNVNLSFAKSLIASNKAKKFDEEVKEEVIVEQEEITEEIVLVNKEKELVKKSRKK